MSLYDPKIQLEKLPENLEGPYQRGIAFLGRCLPGALGIFLLVGTLEGLTGILASLSGQAWVEAIGRTPASNGGQGNLSASAILAMVKQRGQGESIQALVMGDSIFATNIGGGSANEMAREQTIDSMIPGALSIAQEGGEWGTNALLIRKLAADPQIIQQKPLLIVDVNFKFYGMSTSFTPAFPIEAELCSGQEAPDLAAVCQSLAHAWPPAIRALSETSGFLTRALLGQFDFLMTFILRAPIYENNERGRGFFPLRTFRSGLNDATTVLARHRLTPPQPMLRNWRGAGDSMNNYMSVVHGGFTNPAHPKHAWMKALAKSVNQWPGPVLVLWVAPSFEAEFVFKPETSAKLAAMRQTAMDVFTAGDKADLEFVSDREVLTESQDFSDSDHLTPQGHRKLAVFVNGKLSSRVRVK